MRHTLVAGQGPGGAYRAMALLNAAIYDATVATWDAKYAFERPRLATDASDLETAIPTPASPSYPCEHAATAAAAAAVISYLFPDDVTALAELAAAAAQSRVDAGVVYPSDSAAGLALGKEVGDLSSGTSAHSGRGRIIRPRPLYAHNAGFLIFLSYSRENLPLTPAPSYLVDVYGDSRHDASIKE